MKCSRVAFLSFVFAAAAAGPAFAQEPTAQPANTQAENAQPATAQLDIAGSFYHAFTSSTRGNGTKQTPADSDGGLLEIRYLASRFVGFGLAVSGNPANQTFAPDPSSCGVTCPPYPVTTLTATAFEVAPEYVPSMQFGRFRAFAVGGIGFFIVSTGVPANQFATTTRTRPVFIFGGGTDYSLTPRIGIRVQYRYNMYKAPDLSSPGGFPATGKYTASSEPMAGVFYTF